MIYNLPKPIFLIKKWFEFKSFSGIQSLYRIEFKSQTSPEHKTITNLVKLFEKNRFENNQTIKE